MELNLKVLGARIREERKARELSIEKMAEILGISPSFLGLVERGDRELSLENLIAFSEAFNISIDSLIKGGGCINVDYTDILSTLLYGLGDDDIALVIDMVKVLRQHILKQS